MLNRDFKASLRYKKGREGEMERDREGERDFYIYQRLLTLAPPGTQALPGQPSCSEDSSVAQEDESGSSSCLADHYANLSRRLWKKPELILVDDLGLPTTVQNFKRKNVINVFENFIYVSYIYPPHHLPLATPGVYLLPFLS